MSKFHTKYKVFIASGLLLLVSACGSQMEKTPPPIDSPSTGFREASEKVDAMNPENIEQARIDLLRDYQNRVRETASQTFEEFEASTYREPGEGKYIVDGDTPIDDIKHLEEFFETKVKTMYRSSHKMGELIVNQSGGVDTVWNTVEKQNISYCVSTGFGSRYNQAVNAMASAVGAWESVADINFVHDTSQIQTVTQATHRSYSTCAPYQESAIWPGHFFLAMQDQVATSLLTTLRLPLTQTEN